MFARRREATATGTRVELGTCGCLQEAALREGALGLYSRRRTCAWAGPSDCVGGGYVREKEGRWHATSVTTRKLLVTLCVICACVWEGEATDSLRHAIAPLML